jgi:hypothetical protein
MYLVYKLIGFAFRILFRVVGGRMVQNQKEFYANQQRAAQKKEGEIRIEYVPENKAPKDSRPSISREDKGEYVDYEEIK